MREPRLELVNPLPERIYLGGRNLSDRMGTTLCQSGGARHVSNLTNCSFKTLNTTTNYLLLESRRQSLQKITESQTFPVGAGECSTDKTTEFHYECVQIATRLKFERSQLNLSFDCVICREGGAKLLERRANILLLFVGQGIIGISSDTRQAQRKQGCLLFLSPLLQNRKGLKVLNKPINVTTSTSK